MYKNRGIILTLLFLNVLIGCESTDPILTKPFPKKNLPEHDFKLGKTWNSKYYYTKNRPLKFISNYIIKFESLNESLTKVTIAADDPQVINGTTCCGPHGTEARYAPVLGSTVEEYALLEYIASKLGDTSLAPIKFPKD
jgi:hypothetical protein